MTYNVIAHQRVQKDFKKLYRKDKVRYTHLKKRLKILAENPEVGKPLRNVLKGKWRVHIGSSVLIYEIDKKNNRIVLLDFEHHDTVYK